MAQQAHADFFSAIRKYERFPDSNQPNTESRWFWFQQMRLSTLAVSCLERSESLVNANPHIREIQQKILFNFLNFFRWVENMRMVRLSDEERFEEVSLDVKFTATYTYPNVLADYSVKSRVEFELLRMAFLPLIFVPVGPIKFNSDQICHWVHFQKSFSPKPSLAQLAASKVRECLFNQATLFEVSTFEALINMAFANSLPSRLQDDIMVLGDFTQDLSVFDRMSHLVNSNGCPTLIYFSMRAIGKYLDSLQSNQCAPMINFYLEFIWWVFVMIFEENSPNVIRTRLSARNLPYRQVLRCIWPCEQYS